MPSAPCQADKTGKPRVQKRTPTYRSHGVNASDGLAAFCERHLPLRSVCGQFEPPVAATRQIDQTDDDRTGRTSATGVGLGPLDIAELRTQTGTLSAIPIHRP